MLTIAEIKSSQGSQSGTEPFNLPLKCVTVSKLTPATYMRDGIEKTVQNAVLCDTTGFIKAVSFDTSKIEDLQSKTTILMKNFLTKQGSVIITNKTHIFKCPSLEVDEQLLQEATKYLRPPTPPVVTIKKAKRSPIKSVQSVGGTIAQDEAPREISVKGTPVSVRTITLEDKEDKVRLSLWRDLSPENIKPGDYIHATNLVVTSYQDEVQLATTARTKVEVSTPPEEALSLTILGFESGTDGGYELLCQLDGDNITTFTCPLGLMQALLENTELDEDELDEDGDNTSSSLEEKILKSIPGICSIRCQDTVIAQITAPLEKLP